MNGIDAILILNDRLQASTRLVGCVRQADGQQILTQLDPDKKSAVLRQKIG